MDQFLQALVNGILLGGFYAAMVLGFSIAFSHHGVYSFSFVQNVGVLHPEHICVIIPEGRNEIH